MKKAIFSFLIIASFASCKEDPITNVDPNNPNGHVVSEAVGQWLHGNFSMTEYWAYDGSYVGNAFEQSVAFDFNADGSYEQYYAAQTNDWGCSTQAFSYSKGTVVFTDSSFTVYPTEGNFRGYYSCSPQYNFDRDADPSELKVQTYYYTFETDEFGKKWLVIRFDPSDEYPSYFGPTTW